MKRILVFRHGIVINRVFMLPLERHFSRLGYEVHNTTYPTTRRLIEEHARDLCDELEGIRVANVAAGEDHELFVITHSLGGLVLRYALTHLSPPPVKRAVQIAPPNGGSATARAFKKFPPYRWIFGGQAGRQLTEEPPGIFEACGVPTGVEIGIIAGTGGLKLWPHALEKPHDGVVTVEETRLGNVPHTTLPYNHTTILFRRRTAETAAHFLEHGAFSSPPES